MPNSNGAVNLDSLSPQEKEQVEALAEERGGGHEPNTNEKPKAMTAFIVIVALDGNPQVLQLNDPNLDLVSEPTSDLVYGAVSTLIKDLQAQESAQAAAALTVQAMMQQSRAIVEQQQAAGVAQSLDPRLLRRG